MEMDLSNNEYVKDILYQPIALEDTIQYLNQSGNDIFLSPQFIVGKYKRIVVTGMGSSFHALAPFYYRLVNGGYTVHWIETSELIYYAKEYLKPDTLLIVVSQSGSSAEAIHLLKIIEQKVDVIAVVNDLESELAKGSTWKVLTKAGKEYSVSCKTYLSSLVALVWLGDFLLPNQKSCFPSIIDIIPWISEYLSHWKEHVAELQSLYKGCTDIFLIGRGNSLAAAGTGGLILKESAHFHSEGMSVAAFRHGPKEMLSEKIQVLIFEGAELTSQLNEQMAVELQKQGFRAEMISHNSKINAFRLPAISDDYTHLIEMLPIEMTSLALGALHNHQPGVFTIGTKVTNIE